jgi:hypothetical protein
MGGSIMNKEKSKYYFETQATGFWTRRWVVEAESQEEAYEKLNEGMDASIDYVDDFDDLECTNESDFEYIHDEPIVKE